MFMAAQPLPRREAASPLIPASPIFDQLAAEFRARRAAPVQGPFVYQAPEDETPLGLTADQLPDEDQHRSDSSPSRQVSSHAARGMIASPNYSSRGGKKVRLLIVHTAEGARTVESLGAWFSVASRQVSSHAGIDDKRIETYVPYDMAAWTCRAANAIADQVELCGFAAWTRDQWLREHPNMLKLCARWLRERAVARSIPLRKLTPAQVAAGESGVIAHVDWTVGMRDGSHTDCGTGFPWDEVMRLATEPATAPSPAKEVPMAVMPWTLPAGTGMRETIPIPTFDPTQRAELWMVTGWESAHVSSMYFIRDRGPALSPDAEHWGGTGEWTLAPDDRPGFDLGQGCTSVAVMYDSNRPIQCLVRYPA